MPKMNRPRIAGPVRSRDDDDEDNRPARTIDPRKIPYSVAWFREKIALYAFGTVVCGAVMVTAAAWMGGSLGAFGQRLGSGFNVIMRSAGLAVENVSAPGLDDVLKAKVLKASGLRIGENMFGADPYVIKKRVETIEAIGSVKVYRLWPNQISIIADPRDPVALWYNNGEWRVIDQKGRSFANVDPKNFMHLPQVEGANAAEAASGLLDAMSDYPDLKVRMVTAHRVGSRRWDVKFKGGAEVALPDDARMRDALASLNLLNAKDRLLDLPVARVDARHPERFALRPTPGLPQTPPTGGA
jgi:cell division protein FtsQ